MDPYIAQVAANNRKAARIHLAWIVEQHVQHLGITSYFVDANGDGPFMQEIGRKN